MFKKYIEIVPGLVSIDTQLPLVDFLFLTKGIKPKVIKKRLRFHYSVRAYTNDREGIYSKSRKRGRYFVDGDYIVTNKSIYYRRPLFKSIGFNFEYSYRDKVFYFNSLYRYHKVNLGDIFTMGRHIFHVIQVDLLREGFLVAFSASFNLNGLVFLVLAKGRNGKTSLVNSVLKFGGEYISENFTIWDTKTNMLFGTYPVFVNKGRGSNKILRDTFMNNNLSTDLRTSKLCSVVYLSRGVISKSPKKVLSNYFYSRNLGFLKNNFALCYIDTVYSFDSLNAQSTKALNCLQELRVSYIYGLGEKDLLNYFLHHDN